MKRNEQNETRPGATAVPPVHRNGQTETEGPNQATGSNQFRVISSEIAHRVPTSGKSNLLRFLLVATLALVESFFFHRGTEASLTYLSAATFVVFILLSLQSQRMARTGALVALVAFAVSTWTMAVIAMTTEQGIGLVMKPLVARFVLLFLLYRGFEMQDEMQALQNSH